MKIAKYLAAFALVLIVLVGLAQFVSVVIALLKHPDAGLAFAFGEVVGTLLITVLAAAGATVLISSARAVKPEAEDAEPGK